MLKARSPVVSNVGIFNQQPIPIDEQIIIVHRITLYLPLPVDRCYLLDGRSQMRQVWIELADTIRHGQTAIVRKTQYIIQDPGFWEAPGFYVDARSLNGKVEHVPGVFRVQDRELVRKAKHRSVTAQHSI